MKRITFSLCATLVSLCTMAQGNMEKRLVGNPKIDSLVREVYSLGGISPIGNSGVSYSFDGKLHKTVDIHYTLTNDFLPTPPTGNPKKDLQNQKLDSILQHRINQEHRAYEAVRNTCKALIDDARESYVWEYHHNGVDSVRYALVLGEYENGDTLKIYKYNRDIDYSNAPELITFRYNSNRWNSGGRWDAKGLGYFRYEYTPDSVSMPRKNFVPLNKEAYAKLLQPILKQKGITSRQFYVYHDSTYIFKKEDYGKEEFVIRVNNLDPKQPCSETRGTAYTMHSRAQADSVLSQIKTVTLAFLENNPGVWFTFHPYTDYGYRKLSRLFKSEYLTRVPDFYNIYLHCGVGEKEFNIIIVEGTGDMMIPSEWAILKSWKNGKVVYDKRVKNLTPEQAREKTSAGRAFITRQFEPLDDSTSKH